MLIIREEALQILRGLIERVSIGRTKNGLEIEIIGEISKMVERPPKPWYGYPHQGLIVTPP